MSNLIVVRNRFDPGFKPDFRAELDPEHPLAANMGGQWLFNEGANRKLWDSSRNNNHASMGAGFQASDWRTERRGNVLYFGGVSNEVGTVTDPPSNDLDGTTQLSVEIMVMWSTISSRNHIISKYRASAGMRSWLVSLESTNKLRLTVSDDGSGYETKETTETFSADTWYHLVLSYDAGTYNAWSNGVALTVSNFTTDLSIFGGTGILGFGYRLSSGGSPEDIFNGYIHWARVWAGRALTATEAKSLYLRPFECLRHPEEEQILVMGAAAPGGGGSGEQRFMTMGVA